MASAAVFDTYELLEAILSDVPIRRLLLCQRVCKTWQKTIKRSDRLQRGLFFKAEGNVLKNFIDPESQALLDAAPADVEPTEALSGRRTSFMRWSDAEEDELAKVPLLNPLLSCLAGFDGARATLKLSAQNQDVGLATDLRRSWRGMLLTQPPVGKITILNKDDIDNVSSPGHQASLMTPYTWPYEHPRHSHVVRKSGVELGDVVDHLNHLYAGGTLELFVEPLAPLLGSYWRRLSADTLTSRTIRNSIRKYAWAADGESPIGWDPREDGVDHLGGAIDNMTDPRRSDESDIGYYRPLAGRRAGIATINGRPVFGPERPPHMR